MQFVYYTDKTVAQCMTALNERLQAKGTSSRPGLEGWVEKNGNFSVSVTGTVMRRFSRTTRLQGKAEREGSTTVVKGYVSDGVDPRNRAIIFGGLGLMGALIILSGNLLPGLVMIGIPLVLNIPLAGDYENSQVLLGEVQRTLRARTTPPPALNARKTGSKVSRTSSRTTTARPAPGRDADAEEEEPGRLL